MRPASLVALAALLSASCYKDRERFDVPALELVTDQTAVSPTDTITGVVSASDRSGLLLVRVNVITRRSAGSGETDTLRARFDVPETHAVSIPFIFPLDGTAPIGSFIVVSASVFDDQNFVVDVADTLEVTVP